MIFSNIFLRLYDKICFKKVQHFRVTSHHVFTQNGPSHSVNAIQSAHNVVSHYADRHILGPFRAPILSPNNWSVTDKCHNIMCINNICHYCGCWCPGQLRLQAIKRLFTNRISNICQGFFPNIRYGKGTIVVVLVKHLTLTPPTTKTCGRMSR